LARFLVVHPYLDIYGGGEKVCHNVLKTLVAHGQKVELLAFNFDVDKYRDVMGEEFPKEVTIHSLGKRIEVEPPFTVYKWHRNFVKLLKKCRGSLEYDYLFSTQCSSPFEPVFLNKAKKNIVYVHFPDVHFDYDNATLKRKVYLWLYKNWVEQGISRLDLVFCNSSFTREMIERHWNTPRTKDPIVVYPPVNLDAFWCDKPLSERRKRVVYIARFIRVKRHEIMKKLAADLPFYEFVSIGGLVEAEKDWYNKFSENLPQNYTLKTNLPRLELLNFLQDSRVYVHLMEGEHFGIAPIEALASGCITLVNNSGGTREFFPEEFRWDNYSDLKQKIVQFIETESKSIDWEKRREELWGKISILNSKNFEDKIWSNLEILIQ